MSLNCYLCPHTFYLVTHLCVLQDLQESEVCQDELALRVKQLKADLVLFKGLMSNVSSCQSSFDLNKHLQMSFIL